MFLIPTHEQNRIGLGCVKAIAHEVGGLTAMQERLIHAVQHSLFKYEVDLDSLPVATPEQLAEALVTPEMRTQFCGALTIFALANGLPTEPTERAIAPYARALGVTSDALKNLHLMVKKRFFFAKVHYGRRMLFAKKRITAMKKTAFLSAVLNLLGVTENRALKRKYEALKDYPDGSLGKHYYAFMKKNEFALPGDKHAAPEAIVFHDCTHVLAGYDTTAVDEFNVLAFHAGNGKQSPFHFILFALYEFHFGMHMSPLIDHDFRALFHSETFDGLHTPFVPEEFIKHVARGNQTTQPLDEDWDMWAVMDRQVDDLRREYTIHPRT